MRHKATPLQSLPNGLHDLDYLQYAGLVPSLSLSYLRYYEAEQPLARPKERHERRRSEMDDHETSEANDRPSSRRAASTEPSLLGEVDAESQDVEMMNSDDAVIARRSSRQRNKPKEMDMDETDEKETEKAVAELIRHAGTDDFDEGSPSTSRDETSPELDSSPPGFSTSHPLAQYSLLTPLTPMQEIVTQAILDQSEPTSLEDISTYISRVKNLPRRDPQLRQDAMDVLEASVKVKGGGSVRLFKEDPKGSGNWSFVRDNGTTGVKSPRIFTEDDLSIDFEDVELDMEAANVVDEYNEAASIQINSDTMPLFTDLQTLLLKFMLARGSNPVHLFQLQAVAEKNWSHIRRRDGTSYNRECRRVVTTSLVSGRPEHQLFERTETTGKLEDAFWVPGNRALEMLQPFFDKKKKEEPDTHTEKEEQKDELTLSGPVDDLPEIEFATLISQVLKTSRRGGMTVEKLVESLQGDWCKYRVIEKGDVQFEDDRVGSVVAEMQSHPSQFSESSDRKGFWELVESQEEESNTKRQRSADSGGGNGGRQKRKRVR